MPTGLNLTFDDGPDPTWTPRVLAVLERCAVTATFFMVGERVFAYPGLVRRVLDAGHDVQLHCHRHIRHRELSERQLRLDAELALAALESVGVHPSLWRTPWGIFTPASIRVAEWFGLALVRWSIDTHDWRGDSSRQMLTQARPQLPEGGPVLMHDALGPGATREGCENTIALIPLLVATARELQLTIGPMGRTPVGAL